MAEGSNMAVGRRNDYKQTILLRFRLYIETPSASNSGRTWRPPSEEFSLFLGRRAFHRRRPGRAVLGHFKLHGVGRRRQDFHGEAALHGLATRVLVAEPRPALAVPGACCLLGLAPTVEGGAGVILVVRVIAIDRHQFAF